MPQVTNNPRMPRIPYRHISPPPGVGGPVPTSIPYLSGTGTLTCTMGNWTNMYDEPHSYEYKWLRQGQYIDGEETDTYTVAPAEDAGKKIVCEVIAINSKGTGVAFSNHVLVPAREFEDADRPQIEPKNNLF
jgi:hypothetical protein